MTPRSLRKSFTASLTASVVSAVSVVSVAGRGIVAAGTVAAGFGAALGSAGAHAQAAPTPTPPTTAAATTTAPAAPTIDASVVPSTMDTVKRGLRLRVDLGGRYVTAGLPDPPVRLEVDDVVQDRNDVDVSGTVLFGYDRPAGVPIVLDAYGDFNADVGGDSPVSPWLDDTSTQPRPHLYSAFIGLSGTAAEPGLQPFKVYLGRMTEIVESPITYDGVSLGANLLFPGLGHFNAKVWGGLDAPQRLANDPFSRTSARYYSETYAEDDDFISNPGSFYVTRTAITDPILNPVGGLAVDGRFAGFGFKLNHTFMPAQTLWVDGANAAADVLLPMQRSTVGVGYRIDSDWLLANVDVDSKFTDFIPRNVSLRGDALTWDGTTRLGLVTRLQFLPDITAYDGTFRAFDNALQINANNPGAFDQATADAQEQLRVRDQIRHLNFGPPQEHIYASLEAERQIVAGVQALIGGRLRQHFDAADVDAFRTNFYEARAGVSWNPGFALDMGSEVVFGAVDSGTQNNLAYDLNAEGVVSYIEPRVWVKSTMLEGKLSNLTELFVRRNDVKTKGLDANGQWGGALATTTRYDVLDWWQVSLRVDGDALSPIDSLNASYYLGALVGTAVRF